MDRAALRAFTTDALAALEQVATEHNVSIKQGAGRFGETAATVKFEISDISVSGEVLSREAQDFKRLAPQFGLSPEDIGGTFIAGGEQFRITGLKTRRPKNPISADRVKDGRGFKFPADRVRNVVQQGTGRRAAIQAQKGLTTEIKERFATLAGNLSPENLHWDGERSGSEVRKARAAIMREWRALEAQAGRKVSESEAFGFGA